MSACLEDSFAAVPGPEAAIASNFIQVSHDRAGNGAPSVCRSLDTRQSTLTRGFIDAEQELFNHKPSFQSPIGKLLYLIGGLDRCAESLMSKSTGIFREQR